MTIIEKIRAWFKKKKPKPPKDEIKSTKPKGDKVPKTPIKKTHQFKIKYTTTMINTITLSSDMNTLYLIDNGRAIEFPIDEKNGILIGTLNGQITVATALTSTEEEPDTSGSIDRATAAIPERIKLSFEKTQWTMVYRKKSRMMGIIGSSDIVFSLRSEDDHCTSHIFDMNEKVIKLKKTEEGLEVSALNR